MNISVLMSVYKSEKPSHLECALQSVWDDQTIKPSQIVMVVDGMLDKELDMVIEKWKKQLGNVMTVLVNERNLGLTKSLNKGIGVVTGDLIARMDSDDISDPRRFERQVKYLEEHPDIDIVGGSLREFNDSNSELRVRHYPLTHEQAVKYICKATPLAHPTVIMRRRIFDEGLRYNEKYRTSQDIALWYDAVLAGYKIANIPEITVNFRFAGDVFNRRSRAKAWNEFKIYMGGIYRMNGLFTWNYTYPLLRLCFRLMPPKIVRAIYGGGIRTWFLEGRSGSAAVGR
jgi:glycosyltransferase involved in cell wall biosynthesis